jgi:hypothetical protein
MSDEKNETNTPESPSNPSVVEFDATIVCILDKTKAEKQTYRCRIENPRMRENGASTDPPDSSVKEQTVEPKTDCDLPRDSDPLKRFRSCPLNNPINKSRREEKNHEICMDDSEEQKQGLDLKNLTNPRRRRVSQDPANRQMDETAGSPQTQMGEKSEK